MKAMWIPFGRGKGSTMKAMQTHLDMSSGCSQGYKPKTGPQRTQKENIPKQRKFKYFTAKIVITKI